MTSAKYEIHNDEKAAESARQMNAQAMTIGNHIIFDRGEYNPHTGSGQHLLAHEADACCSADRKGLNPSLFRGNGGLTGLYLIMFQQNHTNAKMVKHGVCLYPLW